MMQQTPTPPREDRSINSTVTVASPIVVIASPKVTLPPIPETPVSSQGPKSSCDWIFFGPGEILEHAKKSARSSSDFFSGSLRFCGQVLGSLAGFGGGGILGILFLSSITSPTNGTLGLIAGLMGTIGFTGLGITCGAKLGEVLSNALIESRPYQRCLKSTTAFFSSLNNLARGILSTIKKWF